MKNYINANGLKLNLNFEIQFDDFKRPLRLSGIGFDNTLPPKWIKINGKNELRHYTKYTFRYMDEKGGFVVFTFDPNDNFISKHYD